MTIKLCCKCGAVLYNGGYSHAKLILTGENRYDERQRTERIPFHSHPCTDNSCASGCCLCAACYDNLRTQIARVVRLG